MKILRNALLLVLMLVLVLATHRAAAMDAMSGMGSMDSTSAAESAPGAGDSTSAASTAKLTLAVSNGDSVWMVKATFTGLDSVGKLGPLPNQTVHYYVQRLFGIMPVRDDDNTAVTDDSGDAVIQMPKNIPGDAHGTLILVARVEDDDQTGPVVARDTGNLGTPLPVVADPFPRALWEPNAPIAMILTFAILFGGVWATYGFVVAQLVTIKKDKQHAA
ncbi:MAG TPA: hypothetical protein VFH95_04980 [Candidatus Kapabacteria bacterium]|nr:hypothetical protein [Candidatus Kapabacteria bacterium]